MDYWNNSPTNQIQFDSIKVIEAKIFNNENTQHYCIIYILNCEQRYDISITIICWPVDVIEIKNFN